MKKMIEKITNKMFGLSHLGMFVSRNEWESTYSNDYVLDKLEEIYYLIKTKTNEYCFTNRALICLDGNSESKRNVLTRYDYSTYLIQNISLEAAGAMDLDAELKFSLFPITEYNKQKEEEYLPLKLKLPNYQKGISFSISIHRKDLEQLKALYKTLWIVGKKQMENIQKRELSEKALNMAFNSFWTGEKAGTTTKEFEGIAQFADRWILEKHITYSNEDFREVFEENYYDK